MIRTARPLGGGFVGAAIAPDANLAVGEPIILSGYGVTRPGDWKSGGALRSVELAVREPLSTVLIWAAEPHGEAAGACAGDSGAPIWSADGASALAITAWAQAQHGRGCGGLTQGPLLAPLRAWIAEARAKLAREAP